MTISAENCNFSNFSAEVVTHRIL